MRATRLIPILAVFLAVSGPVAADDAVKPEAPIYFLTPDSDDWLQSAEKGDFLPLMSRFVSEYQATFCGIASSVMALNTLGITPPTAPRWYPYDYWDQDNIFSTQVLKDVAPVSAVEGGGLTLAQLETLLDLSGAKAEKTFASDSDVAAFRKAAREALADPDAILIVNFGRAEFGQAGLDGGGHISPVAAYNAEADRFLILDVARYKYLPSWATAERLYAAMNTPDSSSGKTRGFVVVRKP
ncbi:phytochelatin synthase family protein [Microbaculum marinisediminis]|uniref:glutathione gamma-glutamylcysteinyltransferase n=1 Tax=Microbaculum marinisediminis TaxID=2931392 RepID=A0AAW5R1E0_9HYPH|nr:phytochelatin synthase family protein [Microbaculum sp. A6E488]MCT8972972.1 phytochelatin synthase family protein [Microbaculum sp. A6E488]